MSKSSINPAIGAALAAWGGSSITAGLNFTGWHQINVALFAIGIIFLSRAPVDALRSRIQVLEKRLEASADGAPIET